MSGKSSQVSRKQQVLIQLDNSDEEKENDDARSGADSYSQKMRSD